MIVKTYIYAIDMFLPCEKLHALIAIMVKILKIEVIKNLGKRYLSDNQFIVLSDGGCL
jgi:hypothetical protein